MTYRSKEQLIEQAEKMQLYLEQSPGQEPNDLLHRQDMLMILMAKSGQALAEAKYLQDSLINSSIMDALQKAYEERLSPSTINKFVTTAAKEFNYLVNWLDRINATATHQIDAIRTAISYRKSEMNL